jgi:hypothetical protein
MRVRISLNLLAGAANNYCLLCSKAPAGRHLISANLVSGIVIGAARAANA